LRPIGLGALALVALVPLLLALQRETSPWQAALYVYAVSIGGIWVAIEGLALEYPWVFVIGVFGYALVFALVGAVVIWFKQVWNSRGLLCFPVVWVALEYLVSQPAVLGNWANPIMAIGYTQFDTPLLQAARLSGVTGVSFLVLSINAGLAYALLEPRRVTAWLPLTIMLLVSSLAALIPLPESQALGKPFRVGVYVGRFRCRRSGIDYEPLQVIDG
jgi:apolipoprotein N-acyltransferase